LATNHRAIKPFGRDEGFLPHRVVEILVVFQAINSDIYERKVSLSIEKPTACLEGTRRIVTIGI
jgi:hypothetical protein